MVTKFTFVTCENKDWQALYIDGKLAVGGYKVDAVDALHAICPILPNRVECLEISTEGGIPFDLKDLNT